MSQIERFDFSRISNYNLNDPYEFYNVVCMICKQYGLADDYIRATVGYSKRDVDSKSEPQFYASYGIGVSLNALDADAVTCLEKFEFAIYLKVKEDALKAKA